MVRHIGAMANGKFCDCSGVSSQIRELSICIRLPGFALGLSTSQLTPNVQGGCRLVSAEPKTPRPCTAFRAMLGQPCVTKMAEKKRGRTDWSLLLSPFRAEKC